MIRIGAAVAPSILSRGFHPTAVVGVLGSAVVTGRILEFDVDTIVNALGIAGMQASGLAESSHSERGYKRLYSGMAAQKGILSALLAQAGLTGPNTIFEGGRGFCKAFTEECHLNKLEHQLGKQFEVMKIGFKPYACCRLIHSSIDAIRHLQGKYNFTSDDVVEVSVGTNRVASTLDNPIPTDMLSAQMSIPFSLALSVVKGKNDFEEYNKQNLRHREILDLAKKVRLFVCDNIDRDYPRIIGSTVSIKLKDGRTLVKTVLFPKGETENLMTEKEVLDKFRNLASFFPRRQIEEIISCVIKLEQLQDISELCQLLILPST